MPNNQQSFGNQWLQSAANTATGGIFGIALGGINDRRQLKQQKRLQALQIEGAKEMGDYNYGKQMEMWRNTNYGPQVEQMKLAGLNPGLMYGMSGGGGTTTGTGAGAAPSGGQAPSGGREVQDMTSMGIQGGLLEAQRKVLESQANLNNVEAEKKQGVDTKEAETRILDLTQGITNKQLAAELTKIETRLKTIQTEVANETSEDAIRHIQWNAGKAMEELDQAKRDTWIKDQTYEHVIATIIAESIGAALNNEQIKALTDKTKSETKVNHQQLYNMSAKIAQDWRKLELEGIDTNTRQAAQSHKEWVEDIQQSTGLPVDMIEKVLQAIIVRGALTPGKPTTIKGFGK